MKKFTDVILSLHNFCDFFQNFTYEKFMRNWISTSTTKKYATVRRIVIIHFRRRKQTIKKNQKNWWEAIIQPQMRREIESKWFVDMRFFSVWYNHNSTYSWTKLKSAFHRKKIQWVGNFMALFMESFDYSLASVKYSSIIRLRLH